MQFIIGDYHHYQDMMPERRARVGKNDNNA